MIESESMTAASPGPRALLLSAVLVIGACATPTSVVDTPKVPLGKIQVASTTLGNVELAPAACVSGEHHVFLGADFVDGARGRTLRLIIEPTGDAMLRVFDVARPLEPGIIVRRSACSRFQIAFERTGWQINDIYDVRVSLDVDCRTPTGDSIQGTVAARHCN